MGNAHIGKCALIAVVLAGLSGTARANPVDDFSKDCQLSLYVGGGADIYAPALSRHFCAGTARHRESLYTARDIYATPPHIVKRGIDPFNRAPTENQ